MKGGSTSQETESGYHTDKSEAVVAMQMCDKDMTQLGKPHPTTAQLHLSTFGAVEHKHLLTHLHHL